MAVRGGPRWTTSHGWPEYEELSRVSEAVDLSASRPLGEFGGVLARLKFIRSAYSTTEVEEKIRQLEEHLSSTRTHPVIKSASGTLQIGIKPNFLARMPSRRISKRSSSIAACYFDGVTPVIRLGSSTFAPWAKCSSPHLSAPTKPSTLTSRSLYTVILSRY